MSRTRRPATKASRASRLQSLSWGWWAAAPPSCQSRRRHRCRQLPGAHPAMSSTTRGERPFWPRGDDCTAVETRETVSNAGNVYAGEPVYAGDGTMLRNSTIRHTPHLACGSHPDLHLQSGLCPVLMQTLEHRYSGSDEDMLSRDLLMVLRRRNATPAATDAPAASEGATTWGAGGETPGGGEQAEAEAAAPGGAAAVVTSQDYAAVMAATSGAAFVVRGEAEGERQHHMVVGASLGCSQTCGGGTALPSPSPPPLYTRTHARTHKNPRHGTSAMPHPTPTTPKPTSIKAVWHAADYTYRLAEKTLWSLLDRDNGDAFVLGSGAANAPHPSQARANVGGNAGYLERALTCLDSQSTIPVPLDRCNVTQATLDLLQSAHPNARAHRYRLFQPDALRIAAVFPLQQSAHPARRLRCCMPLAQPE